MATDDGRCTDGCDSRRATGAAAAEGGETVHLEEVGGEAAVLLQVDAGLAEQGVGLAQAALLTLVATVTFTSGMELYLLSLVGLDMQCYWHITPPQAAALFTLVFLGKCVGEPIWGAASDAWGRRPVIIALCVITAATATASIFAPSFTTFAALRFAFGFALPLDNIVIVWLLELLPSKIRGVLGAAIGICWVAANVTAIATASWLMSRYGWRYLITLAALPAVTAAIMSLAAPESPLWLVAKGRLKEAEGVLRHMSALNRRGAAMRRYCCCSRDEVVYAGQWSNRSGRDWMDRSADGSWEDRAECPPSIGPTASMSSYQLPFPRPLWRVLGSRWLTLGLTLLLTAMLAVGQSTGNLLPQQAAAVHNAGLHCTSSQLGAHLQLSAATYRGLVLDSLGGLPGLIIGLLIIDRLGRLSSLGWMQALALATWAPLLGMRDAGTGSAWLTSIAFIAQWWYTAALTVNNVWQVEVFPTASRSLCVALNGIMGNLGNVVAPYLAAILVQEYARPRLVVVILVALAALGLMSALLARWKGLETTQWPGLLARSSSQRSCSAFRGASSSYTTSENDLHVVEGVLDGLSVGLGREANIAEGSKNRNSSFEEGLREQREGESSDSLNATLLREPLCPESRRV